MITPDLNNKKVLDCLLTHMTYEHLYLSEDDVPDTSAFWAVIRFSAARWSGLPPAFRGDFGVRAIKLHTEQPDLFFLFF